MIIMKKFSFFSVMTVIVCLASATLFLSSCEKEDDLDLSTPPDVPAILEVGDGYAVSYHTYAEGVQVYVCTETSPGVYAWVFKEPIANLYSNADFTGIAGTHYAGPTWESNSGSTVVATKLEGVTVDQNAIPWLKLGTVSETGPGIFDNTTHIQRVHTVGGKAPETGANASTVDQEQQVPYTAEYYFYKAE
jgi:hypothetical protein